MFSEEMRPKQLFGVEIFCSWMGCTYGLSCTTANEGGSQYCINLKHIIIIFMKLIQDHMTFWDRWGRLLYLLKNSHSNCKKRVRPSLVALHKMARVKKLWNPGGGQEMVVMVSLWQKCLITTIQVNFCPYPSFTRNQHKIHLNCC